MNNEKDPDEEPRTEKENIDAPQEEFISDAPPSTAENARPVEEKSGETKR